MKPLDYLPVSETGVPMLFWGQPGIGKSAAIQGWAREHGMACETLIGSLSDSADVLGFAIQNDGKVDFAPPGWMERLADGGVLFLDEINRGCRLVRSAMLRLVAERAVHQHRLPDSVVIVAAANDDGEIDDLDDAMLSRFAHLDWTVNKTDFVRQIRSAQWDLAGRLPSDWADRLPAARDTVASFLDARNELLLHNPDGRGSCSPRTWDMASKCLAACDSLGLSATPLLCGLIGDGAAKEFKQWYDKRDLPDPRSALAGKWKPGTRCQQRAVLLSLLPLVVDCDSWDAAWEQLGRCRRDVAVLAARHIASRRPDGASVPESLAELVDVVS